MEAVKTAPEGWTTLIGWTSEAIRSATAEANKIDNFPTREHVKNMLTLVDKIFLPVREHVGKPIRVSSFYRSSAVNKKIKGASKTSQHLVGEAMDICKYPNSLFTNKDLFEYIKANLDFDQLIWEYGTTEEPQWVHVSYKRTGKNRNQILFLLK